MKFKHFLLAALAAYFACVLEAGRRSAAGKVSVLTLLPGPFSPAAWPEASHRAAHRSNLPFLFVFLLHHPVCGGLGSRIAVLARAAALGEAWAREGRPAGGGRAGGGP